MVGVVPFSLYFVALLGTMYPVILRHFHLVVADRRATARTTDPLSHAATSQKKSDWFLSPMSICSSLLTVFLVRPFQGIPTCTGAFA